MFSMSLSLSCFPFTLTYPWRPFGLFPCSLLSLFSNCMYCLAVVGFCAVVVGRCLFLCCFPLVARSFVGGWAPAPWVRLLLLSFVVVVVRVVLACCLLWVPLLFVLLSVCCSLSWSCLSLRLLAIMLVVVVVAVVLNANLNSN